MIRDLEYRATYCHTCSQWLKKITGSVMSWKELGEQLAEAAAQLEHERMYHMAIESWEEA